MEKLWLCDIAGTHVMTLSFTCYNICLFVKTVFILLIIHLAFPICLLFPFCSSCCLLLCVTVYEFCHLFSVFTLMFVLIVGLCSSMLIGMNFVFLILISSPYSLLLMFICVTFLLFLILCNAVYWKQRTHSWSYRLASFALL